MTNTQINAILDMLNQEYGEEGGSLYTPDAWLDAEDIAEITLSTDENIYPDRTCQVYFDSVNSLLKTRLGKRKGNTFFPKHDPAMVTAYEGIVGIIMVDSASTKSPYKRGSMV